MNNHNNTSLAENIVNILIKYQYETNKDEAKITVQNWIAQYPENWVYSATIETLYQGRYKTYSIEQLLRHWQRQGYSQTHYSGDFERLILRQYLP